MGETRSPFKLGKSKVIPETDIEGLFQELKNRDPEFRGLYSYQADILREYYKTHLESRDVGIELPTGSGKTLIGLLIGEWRRKYRSQRVLYLCPTKQLARQVGNQSKKYGIEACVFTGSKWDYNQENLTLYRQGKVIAISTYSGLFNIDPGINDPQTIIFDDAHGAETYIGSMWSLNIDRRTNPDLYSAILKLFETDLSTHFISAIYTNSREKLPYKTEMVPFGSFFTNLSALRDIIDTALPNPDASRLYFSWLPVRSGLEGCHVYISFDSILIRPYIPPTLTHEPFAKADQRIYMSATLGRGGELERITGIHKIKRIPVPKAYESHSIGRRLYLFPDFTKDTTDYTQWLADRLSSVNRSLVMCPTQYKVNQFRRIIEKSPKKIIEYNAGDIEESLEQFENSKNSVLLLSNRYDGLDLPHGICKQVIIDGLPTGTNLQEAFLEERLNLNVLLRERIKTRIEQASGRCTRSNTDRAAIIMLGQPILAFCTRNENQKIFHPEIRAEIRFALDQSVTTDELNIMIQSFLRDDEHWQEAEEDISNRRSMEELPDTSVTDILAKNIEDEINFAYNLWTGSYEDAISCGKKVIDGLNGNQVTSYRALWCYFVATVAFMQSKRNEKYKAIIRDELTRAKKACPFNSWIPNAMNSMLPEEKKSEDIDELETIISENIVSLLSELGSVGDNFLKKLNEVETLLNTKKPSDFDRGLTELGRMLGFNAWKPAEGDSVPDSVWTIGNHSLFLFEGKSNESQDGGISARTCKQASGHINWAMAEHSLKDIKKKYSIVVSPREKIDKGAVPHADELFYISIPEVLELYRNARVVLVSSRDLIAGEKGENLQEHICVNLRRQKLNPAALLVRLTKQRVAKLSIN